MFLNSRFRIAAILILLVSAITLATCSARRTDMRTLLPADSLLYIETDDVAEFLRPAIENENVKRHSDGLPDLSALKDVQIAIGVTGFTTEEESADDGRSVGIVRPIFVAVIDSNAWNYQVSAFVEKKVGPFIENIYGDGVQKDATDQNGGRLYSWTASPTRRTFLFLSGSVFYFANDENALNKALAVRRGEAESFAVGRDDGSKDAAMLARGFVTADGIGQIASLAGVYMASQMSDDEMTQGAVASIVPQLIRNTIADARFDVRGENGRYIERFDIALKPDAARGIGDAMRAGNAVGMDALRFIPQDASSVSQYNFNDPPAAFRAVVATLGSGLEPPFKALFPVFAESIFEPYGIDNPELFLNAADANILTVRSADDNESVVIAKAKDETRLVTSFDNETAKTLLERMKPEHGAIKVFGDNDLAAKCIAAADSGNALRTPFAELNETSTLPAVRTFSIDRTSMPALVDLLSIGNIVGEIEPTASVTETRFDGPTVTRTTTSETGSLLSLIAELLTPGDV